jgi:hypothetical protein
MPWRCVVHCQLARHCGGCSIIVRECAAVWRRPPRFRLCALRQTDQTGKRRVDARLIRRQHQQATRQPGRIQSVFVPFAQGSSIKSCQRITQTDARFERKARIVRQSGCQVDCAFQCCIRNGKTRLLRPGEQPSSAAAITTGLEDPCRFHVHPPSAACNSTR